ncbi:MAG: GNAT family N-acetyltransferase [Saprospiraceae bacterium]
MMEYIELDNITYGFARNFKHDHDIRLSFNKLTEATFRFNFEKWYQNGFWADNYIPYSLLHNNKVISNVSVNIIEFVIDKEKKIGIQIGTVMTDEKYRRRGLNRYIMEQVLNDWKDKSDFIYLFANDSVLDFYPRFNFETIDEFQCSSTLINSPNASSPPRKLNIEDNNDKELLVETANMSPPMSKISMRNNVSLIMFHCMFSKKDSIYYIENLKAIVIADYKGDTLYLNDVFSKGPIELNDVIQYMSKKDVKRLVLGFTPLNETGYKRSLLKQEDTTLFVMKGKSDYFKKNNLMFPVLSYA